MALPQAFRVSTPDTLKNNTLQSVEIFLIVEEGSPPTIVIGGRAAPAVGGVSKLDIVLLEAPIEPYDELMQTTINYGGEVYSWPLDGDPTLGGEDDRSLDGDPTSGGEDDNRS